MNKDDMIRKLSEASDSEGHLLVDMLCTYKKTGLKDLTTDQVFQYYKQWKDNNMNKFIVIGRLTADPEIRYSQDGKVVARFNFAVNRRFKREGEADADFFSCVAFGKTAETIEKCSIGKGTKLLLDAEVRNNNYEKDGVKHYGTQVVVNSFEFCESKGSGQAPTAPQADSDGFINIPDSLEDEGLPFN